MGKISDWMLKHGIAQMDPDPEPGHKDWPRAATDRAPEILRPKDDK